MVRFIVPYWTEKPLDCSSLCRKGEQAGWAVRTSDHGEDEMNFETTQEELSYSLWDVIMENHRLDGLTNRFISHSSGGWRFKIRVPAWLGSGESSCLGYILP